MMLSLRWSERPARGPHGNPDGEFTVAKKKAAKKVAKVAKKAPAAKKVAKKKVAKKAKCSCK